MCVYVFVSVYMCGCVVVIFKTSWTSSGWANWSGSVLGFGSVQECGLGQMERSFWSCNVYVCEPIMPYLSLQQGQVCTVCAFVHKTVK